ncbi:hypothetical protein LEP1GSC088_4777 [Leptospira interrogans str. L1207]|nr:hypothetical protein LEP1GSC088_4777 [Leptospira interrogans str. L1207]
MKFKKLWMFSGKNRKTEKQKNRESLDDAAIEFVTKADLVIQRAEKKEIFLTEDQKRRIKNNLLKIRTSLVRSQTI